MAHIDLVPSDKIDFIQSKTMKFAYMGKLSHMNRGLIGLSGPAPINLH